MKLFSIISLGLLAGCSHLSNHSNEPWSRDFVGMENGQLLYLGNISQKHNKALFEAFNNVSDKPNRLVVSSLGGDVEAGLELGNWIQKNKMDVEVLRLCASSCADYVLTTGNHKYLHKDSILLWHGSAWQQHWEVDDDLQESFNQSISALRKKESAFFARIKVDNLITVYGQLERQKHPKDFTDNQLQGYDYSLADMQRFGLTNIVLLDKEWDWRRYSPAQQHMVKRLKLGSDYQFTLNRF
ncbi:hypothetical protein [Vibrio tritonius]|uniref:hypothetical protein n=1 Tax=Vibrio tritonius TaxID=1435069 RepID=UPI000838B49D|nr:hypothetical protein [Vibrio tritonius]